MLFEELALTSAKIAATAGKKKKVELLAACLARLGPDERAIAARYLAGVVPQKLGIGYAAVHELAVPPAAAASLEITEVDRRFTELAALGGAGSATVRKGQLGALFARATAVEQRLLGALIVGELRQGALEALVVEAVAKVAALAVDEVRRAYMLAGDLGVVAATALGGESLARFGLTLFRPILPMLAQTAEDTGEALASLGGEMALEQKLDGFRVQIHKDGDAVRIYTRNLNDTTHAVPELVAAIAKLPARRLILDGEAIGFAEDGRPLPFQDTMRRFGRRGDDRGLAPGGSAAEGGRGVIDDLRAALPLSLVVFDALLVDDDTLLARPARERFAVVDALGHAVPRLITADAGEAAAFYARTVAAGHEGVMAKGLDAPYAAGSRGAAWLKIKRIHRLDLLVIAAEWGSGRRKGWLSNLHLGARDPAGGEPVMLGKTFKGPTDAMLTWQTAELLAREVDRDGHIVYVRPELVVETAFNDVQRSSQYPGGLALRHARIVRYRQDKTCAEADTIDAVRAIAVADGVTR